MDKISTFLWFDKNAEEAANFYVSVFRNARIVETMRWPEGGHGKAGEVLTITFELEGRTFVGLNGGKQEFSFNESVSFMIDCSDQAEIDHYWTRLTADGGAEIECGWLKDKYGVRWQVAPGRLLQLMNSADTAQAARVMQAMMKMKKIDLAAIEAAAIA